MAAIDFLCLLLLILFTVTSSVNAGPDGTSSVSPVPDQGPPFKSFSLEVEHHTFDDKKETKNLANTSINTEGGVISMPITQDLNIENTAVTRSDKLDQSRIRENIPKERNASPSVVARKGVEEKIKPRKGVEENMDPERIDISFNQTSFKNTKPVIETNSVFKITHIYNQSETSNITTSRLNATISQSTEKTNLTNLITQNVKFDTGIENNVTKPMGSSYIEKHIPKPKPTVTSVDGPEVDDYRPSSRMKSPPLGMSRKIDYIVPVVTTIFALPLLGAAIFILYKRGRDCWDKRHYRRMDFLIDGIYND